MRHVPGGSNVEDYASKSFNLKDHKESNCLRLLLKMIQSSILQRQFNLQQEMTKEMLKIIDLFA